MTSNQEYYHRLVQAFGVDDLDIPMTLVKLYGEGETIPDAVMEHHPVDITITSCQAHKQSSLGDAVCLTRENIGCVAAAISLGLVDQHETEPLQGPRVYTEIMREQLEKNSSFAAPSPADFTEGRVYACRDAGRQEFCLFGEKDTGRFKDVATARKAVSGMTAIQPATIKGLFFYSPEFSDIEVIPDVVLLTVRPVELTRIVQAYQYMTGERIEASMGGLRMVNSDLIARPYLTGRINVSSYCLGARLIARFDADKLGMGIPFTLFRIIVQGMEESAGGYPFNHYPGASE